MKWLLLIPVLVLGLLVIGLLGLAGAAVADGEWGETVMLLICAGLVCLPTRWDPAIRVKEWTER